MHSTSGRSRTTHRAGSARRWLPVTRWLGVSLLALSAALSATPGRAGASSYGTLSNFDVVNDTTHPCHGFEIELEDIQPSDIPYTFGGSYIRYGAPEVLDATVDPAHPRVIVRYRHWNGSGWEATPVAPANVTPSGHDCYANGPIGNYESSGCEHYGVSLSASPSRTTYRWLIATDPTDLNTTFAVEPQTVDLPVPVWSVVAAGGGNVDVRAEVEPVEEEQHAQYGEPQWMKVFKVESELALQPEDLNRLLLGVAGGIVPDHSEVETEWKLIQSKPGNAEGANEDADVREDPLAAGKRSVVRRYEFYRYTGPRDPENNEANACVNDDAPVPADAPVEGCSDLGDFIGAQNVAIDAVALVAVEGTNTPSPQPSATPTVPPAATATGAATPSPTAEMAACAGDCSGNGRVTIEELVTMVQIALGNAAVTTCAAGDIGSDGAISIDELVLAVNDTLAGCGGL